MGQLSWRRSRVLSRERLLQKQVRVLEDQVGELQQRNQELQREMVLRAFPMSERASVTAIVNNSSTQGCANPESSPVVEPRPLNSSRQRV